MARGYCIRGGVLFMDAPAEFFEIRYLDSQPVCVIVVSRAGTVAIPYSLIPRTSHFSRAHFT